MDKLGACNYLQNAAERAGRFCHALRYTQQSLLKVDFCWETSVVKLCRLSLAVAAFLLLLFPSVRLFAGTDAPKQYDPKLFQELRWRLIGPPRGGRTLAAIGVRGQPGIFYFGGVGGGGLETKE